MKELELVKKLNFEGDSPPLSPKESRSQWMQEKDGRMFDDFNENQRDLDAELSNEHYMTQK